MAAGKLIHVFLFLTAAQREGEREAGGSNKLQGNMGPIWDLGQLHIAAPGDQREGEAQDPGVLLTLAVWLPEHLSLCIPAFPSDRAWKNADLGGPRGLDLQGRPPRLLHPCLLPRRPLGGKYRGCHSDRRLWWLDSQSPGPLALT